MTRKSFFIRNTLLGTLDFTGLEHWASFQFFLKHGLVQYGCGLFHVLPMQINKYACFKWVMSMTILISQGSDTTVDLIKVCERNYFTGANRNSKEIHVSSRLLVVWHVFEFQAIWWAGYFFPFFSHKLSITFVLHAIFFFWQALAGNFFQNHPPFPPPPPSRVKWSAPYKESCIPFPGIQVQGQ